MADFGPNSTNISLTISLRNGDITENELVSSPIDSCVSENKIKSRLKLIFPLKAEGGWWDKLGIV